MGTINRCTLEFPFHAQALENLSAFSRCAAGAMRFEGIVILVVIGVFLLVAAALSVVVPWVELRRLARAGSLAEISGVTERFSGLCAEAGLARRRLPGLHVAGLGLPVVNQAFTTALPWRRSLVILPAKVAISREDPDRFDPVVLHELAHVRARDVSWVSAVRGITWLTVPLVVLACVPGVLNNQGATIPGTVLVQAGLFAVITAAFAAGLLRLRELEADRQAADWLGSPDALQQLLDDAGPRASTGWRAIIAWLVRPLERHPSATARARALLAADNSADTSFAFPLAVGVVTAIVMSTANYLTFTLDLGGGTWPRVAASATVGSLVLGFGLTPGLFRQAAAAHQAGVVAPWWRPVAGTAAGLLIGLLAAPANITGPALAVLSGAGFEYEAVKVVLTVAAGAGIAALAAGLASLAAAWPYRLNRRWMKAVASLVMASTAAAVLWPIISPATGVLERVYLVTVLPGLQWNWLAAPYLAAALVMGVPMWLRKIRQNATGKAASYGRVRAVLAPVVIPFGAAVIGTTLFLPHSLIRHGATGYEGLQVVAGRWWICTLIGWAVLVVLTVGRGVSGLPRAWVSAYAATLLAGAELVIYGAAHHHRPDLLILSKTVIYPGVWLFYLGVPTACLALLTGHTRAGRLRPWLLPATAGLATIVVAVGVIGLGSPLTTLLFGPAAPSSPSPRASSPPLTVADSGRILTAAGANVVISEVTAALSGTWTGHQSVTTRTTVTTRAPSPPISPAACGPLAREDFLNDLSRPLLNAVGQYTAVPGVVPVGNATLSVTIESYAKSVPTVVFSAAQRSLRACHAFTIVKPAGSFSFTVHNASPLRLQFPSWQAVFSVRYKNTQTSATWIVVGVGHNLILISQYTTAVGTLLPPQQKAINAALNAVLYGLSHAPRT